MFNRLSDFKDFLRQENDDFVVRKIGPSQPVLGGVFGVCFLVLLAAGYNVRELGETNLIALITAVFLGLTIYMVLQIGRVNEQVLASDFENALFAGSAAAGTEFCVVVKDGGEIVYISPGFKKFFKQDKGVMSNTIDWLLLSINVPEQERTNLTMAFKQKTLGQGYFEHTDAFGLVRKTQVTIEPLPRPKGYAILKALKPYVAVPETVKGDVATNTLPSNFFTLMDALPIGAYILTPQNTLSYANPILAETLGYSVAEITNGKFDWAQMVFGSESMGAPPTSWQGETALRGKDKKPIKAFVSQLLIDDGKPGEQGLRIGFARVIKSSVGVPTGGGAPSSEFMEKSPIALGIIDGEGKVIYSNPALRKIAAKTDDEKAGWYFVQSVHPEKKTDINQWLKEGKNPKTFQKKNTPLDIVLQAKQGAVTASLYLTPLHNDTMEEPKFLISLIDTTEFKNLEQRMVHSQKMQAVGQLAGGIAHDFNNLLTAIMGFCDLLLIRHPAGDPSFADIMQVKQNSNRAANLVRQLLAFSRKQTLQPEVIDVTDALAELTNLIRRLIGENIELKFTHGRDLYPVKVDQGQLEQVVINLAVNARDAMKEKGGVLAIKTQNVVIDNDHPVAKDLVPPAEDEVITEGEYVLIEVIDTGHGIPPNIVTKIFEPFFSTKEVGSGTGLGLATVYGIVKQTGGYIYVTSAVGKGTKFSIYLKRAQDVEAAAAKEAKKAESEKDTAGSDLTGAGTILLVEDEDPVRVFSARALRNKGYHVLEADCGEAALRVMEEKGMSIELIITDVVMPGINGPTMVEEVMRKFKDINVIFISGYAEDAFVKTYGSERKFNFLPKPYTLKQLATKVKDVMDARKENKA
ncbi:MAG: response regulator [Proteobacteria bacterium]|nr:response regulator [Pseudomonadota bacterium]